MTVIPFHPDWPQVPGEALPKAPVVSHPFGHDGIPVIIAEDEPVTCRLVTSVIEAGGFRTIVTHDGEQAMTALRAQDGPCLAVLDWMMPHMDGAEICRRMREGQRQVYIILLTARDTKHDAAQGLEGGADDYLVKPFDSRELLARIREGMRLLGAQIALNQRVRELEDNLDRDQPLRAVHLPL